MSGSQSFQGLCLSCRNAAECTFPRESTRPVWQCEEFTGEGKAPERVSVEGTFPPRTGLTRAESSLNPRMGLCKNCANREDCRYPKPEGGVWRCEEYG